MVSNWSEKNILVVDDSEINRLIIVESLKAKGFSTCEASDGQQAIDLIVSKKPDLVLLDLIMPVMDGFDAMAKLHEMNIRVPIIVITAYLKENSINRCRELGADGFLTKPIKMQELFKLISGIFDIHSDGKIN
jgi:two-component system response regulator VicR